MKNVGTMSIGVKAPIIRLGDDLDKIVASCVKQASDELGLPICQSDVVAVTEAVVARSQGNYATVEQIAKDVRNKTVSGCVGVLYPIMSRNRFSMILKGISSGADSVVIQLAYPSDEVGNPLITLDQLDEQGVNPYTDSFTEEEFVAKFGKPIHPFTGVNYLEFYHSVCPNCKIVISNRVDTILSYTNTVICADIHSRFRTQRLLKDKGAVALTLSDLMTSSVDGSGWNSQYGLLGSNLATDNSVKLFPRDCQEFVTKLDQAIFEVANVHASVMVYGDGAFKDPVGGIWELADPVVSPAHSSNLDGSPNELKLKYLADTLLKGLNEAESEQRLAQMIKTKGNLTGSMLGQGTTPRKYSDLLGSLADLTSGSGDKGTPIIWIKNYFSNFSDFQQPDKTDK